MRVVILLTVIVIVAGVGHCAEPTASEADSVAATKRSWQTVLEAQPNKKEFPTKYSYWSPIHDTASEEAKTLFAAEHRRRESSSSWISSERTAATRISVGCLLICG